MWNIIRTSRRQTTWETTRQRPHRRWYGRTYGRSRPEIKRRSTLETKTGDHTRDHLGRQRRETTGDQRRPPTTNSGTVQTATDPGNNEGVPYAVPDIHRNKRKDFFVSRRDNRWLTTYKQMAFHIVVPIYNIRKVQSEEVNKWLTNDSGIYIYIYIYIYILYVNDGHIDD